MTSEPGEKDVRRGEREEKQKVTPRPRLSGTESVSACRWGAGSWWVGVEMRSVGGAPS